MVNTIPVIGWLVAFVLNDSLAVPFWYFWTRCALGAEYFAFLPAEWHQIPFFDCVGLCFVFQIARAVIYPGRSGSSTFFGSEKEEEE